MALGGATGRIIPGRMAKVVIGSSLFIRYEVKGRLEGVQSNPKTWGRKKLTMVMKTTYPSPGMILQVGPLDSHGF